MGLIGSQARMQYLVARKVDLEAQLHMMNTSRLILAMQQSQSSLDYANQLAAIFDPNNPDAAAAANQAQVVGAQMNARSAQLAVIEKGYDMAIKDLEIEQKAITTEMDAVDKIIQKAIEGHAGFKTLG